jgi:ribosome-associated translation inhibitor RaiA
MSLRVSGRNMDVGDALRGKAEDSGALLQASASGTDPTLAYEAMADHIEKRLRRYNRKLKSHRRLNGDEDTTMANAYVLEAPDGDDELDEDFSPAVIAESTSNLRRMSVGEAVMQLDLAQHDVLVFRHAGHGGVNVVYRRADGNIGWIDPAQGAN